MQYEENKVYQKIYEDLNELNILRLFNVVRERLFMAIANGGPKSYVNSALPEHLEKTNLSDKQKEILTKLIKPEEEESGISFKHYSTAIRETDIEYFVLNGTDLSSIVEGASPAGAYISDIVPDPEKPDSKILSSLIIVSESDSRINENTYSITIKHELVHLVIRVIEFISHYIIGKDPKLSEEDAELFEEFLCDFVPFASDPSLKGNGLIERYKDVSETYMNKMTDAFQPYLNAMYEYYTKDTETDASSVKDTSKNSEE